jgi:hypothetical protein
MVIYILEVGTNDSIQIKMKKKKKVQSFNDIANELRQIRKSR